MAAVPPRLPRSDDGDRFHLATVLAIALAAAGAGEHRPDLVIQSCATPRLRDAAPEQRPQLAAAADYRVAERLDGGHIVLVDDVILTGATLAEIASRLRDAGAAVVIAAVAARTRLA